MERVHHRKRWCGCCDLKSAAMVAGTFVMTISFVQFMLILFYIISYCIANSEWLGMMLNSALGGYVALAAFDLLMIIMSIVMMERNAQQENKTVLLIWLIMMAVYVLFEAALNITFFIMLGPMMFVGIDVSTSGYNNNNPGSVLFAGVIVYWLLKLGMYIAAMIAVHWRWHELMKLKDAAYARYQQPALALAPAPVAVAPPPQVVYQTAPAVQQPTYQVVQQPAQQSYVISQQPALTYKY